MHKLFYTMHFTGRVSRTLTSSSQVMLKTTGAATSLIMSTIIGPNGVDTDLRVSEGDLAFLESTLRVIGPDSFLEGGTICFGENGEHLLRFSTLGQGRFSAGVEPRTLAGTITRKIDGGLGQFTGAQGVIASNFTISDAGQLSDLHCGLILLPD